MSEKEQEKEIPVTEQEEGLVDALKVIALQLESGRTQDEVIEELVDGGLEKDKAREIVESIASELEKVRAEEEEIVNAIADRLFLGEDPDVIVEELVEAGAEESESREFVKGIKSEVERVTEEEEKLENYTRTCMENDQSVDEMVEGLVDEGYQEKSIRPVIEGLYEMLSQQE